MVNIHKIKEEICDIGRRIYAKGFAAGNDGNITYRLNDKQVLCTPTMVSKGFLKPEDICVVDMEGKQLSGTRKRTSEVLMHLAILKARPDVMSVVHCHPPHATAFAVAREPIPQCVLPEIEVFLGETPIAVYETPGDTRLPETLKPFVQKTNVIILANHGTVSYGETVERAYWWTEILDAYCRILMLAKDLGRVTYLSEEKSRELLDLKTKWGWKDPRVAPGMENCDICANDIFRESWKGSGVERKAFEAPPTMGKKGKPASKAEAVRTESNQTAEKTAPPAGESGRVNRLVSKPGPNGEKAPSADVDQEKLIQAITERVLASLNGKV